MATVATWVTVVVLIRFIADGVDLTILNTHLTFKAIDATVYAALLSPVYAALGYMHNVNTKNNVKQEEDK